jgi:adenine-specific DNA methylase
MPYLELSEFWNSILGFEADFSREIVISNARERTKTSDAYKEAMVDVLSQVPRILTPDGVLVLLYNAREADEWEAFRDVCGGKGSTRASGLRYLGVFPCRYSARSVVQDNRKGSLKHDLALVFCKAASLLCNGHFLQKLETIPDWSSEIPGHLRRRGLA